MEVLQVKESGQVSTSLEIEQPIEANPHNIFSVNESNFVDTEDRNEANFDQVNDNEKPDSSTNISKYLDTLKPSSESELLVQNLLFDTKPDEYCSSNSVDEINMDCIIKPNNIDSTNLSVCLPSNETQILLSTDESTFTDTNNTFTSIKKQGFSIEEISKDESSQSSQSMSTYSNDYTCFLTEQSDAISNLTPFKRSNSYFFDSPVKKLCSIKLSSKEKPNEVSNSTLYSNENYNNIFTGFTSIQNDLEVDCIQDRYDGSDSGFGSELAEDKNGTNLDLAVSTPNLPYKNDFILNQKSSFEDLKRTSNEFLSAMEVLKPKFSDSVLEMGPLEVVNNCSTVKGILKRNTIINYDVLTTDDVTTVKNRKNINFANVTVFYFPRVQGFTCVPSQVIIKNYII